jgi:hypothetical protein
MDFSHVPRRIPLPRRPAAPRVHFPTVHGAAFAVLIADPRRRGVMSWAYLAGLVLALALGVPAAGAFAQCTATDAAAAQGFDGRVMAYVALHRRLEGPLPTFEISDDLADVHAAMEALARQIRHARRHAHQGDLFTPEAAHLFRRRIAECLPPEQMTAVLAEHDRMRQPRRRGFASTGHGLASCRSRSSRPSLSVRCRRCRQSCSTASSDGPSCCGITTRT